MIWDDTYPQDSLMANTIHTILQNSKVMLRERFEVPNGTFNEHNDASSDDIGRHEPSVIGFSGSIADWVSRPTTGLVDGSLWYVEAPVENKGIYFIKNGNYVLISAVSHTQLEYTQYDDELEELNPHTEYIMNNGGTFTAAGQFNTLQLTLSRGESSYCLPETHKNLKWSDAHVDDGIMTRHFADDVSISKDKLPITSVFGNHSVVPDTGFVCFPLTRNASTPHVGVWMSRDEIKATDTDIKVYSLGGTY